MLVLLEPGLSVRQIGEALFPRPNTVLTQARSIYRKLNVNSRANGRLRLRPWAARAFGITHVIRAFRATGGKCSCDGAVDGESLASPDHRRSAGELAREAFGEAPVTVEDGNTIVAVRDQAELFGFIQRISDLGPTMLCAVQSEAPTHLAA